MPGIYPQQAVIVAQDAFESDDPYEIVQSNIDFLNDQFEAYLTEEEVSKNALRSYYVDYFLAQFENGGFSQFVYNSRWGDCVQYITDGFAAIGAIGHLEVFENAARQMMELPGIDGLKKFLQSDYFDENIERDILNKFNDEFEALSESENLIELNAQWLRGLPDLVVLSPEEMSKEIQLRSEAISNREERIVAALAAEPRSMKLIRLLCDRAGQTLDRVTAGDPTFHYQGQNIIAWHFLTNHGHFHMADIGEKAIMFKGHTDEVVSEIEVPEDLA